MNHRKRIAAIRKSLRREKLAALLIATREGDSKNVRYLSGFSGTTGVLAVSARGAVLAVDGRYTERAGNEVGGIRVVSAHKPSPEGYLTGHVRAALDALQVPRGARVGIEGERVSVLAARAWQSGCGQKLIPTRLIVERLRGVKDAREIRLIAHACKRTMAAFDAVSPRIKSGMSEREVALILEDALREHGALAASFETIIASGPNSAIPHHATGKRKLRAGEPVVIDFGGIYPGGYCSDVTRTVFVPGKKPERELVVIYRMVHEANERAFRALHSGMTFKEYDEVARTYIKECGYGEHFAHGLGHSLGLEVHDPYDYGGMPIAPGAVFTDEPGIYLPGVGGVRIEDDIVMTKKGARRLTPRAYNPF